MEKGKRYLDPQGSQLDSYHPIEADLKHPFLNIIQESIKNKINTEVVKEQFGFRKNSGTR